MAAIPGGLIFLNLSGTAAKKQRATAWCLKIRKDQAIKLLEPELFFLNFSTPVYKMWIIQEPNTLELWNKLNFEEENTENIYHV